MKKQRMIMIAVLVVLIMHVGFNGGAAPLAPSLEMVSLDHRMFPFIYLDVNVNSSDEGHARSLTGVRVYEDDVPQPDYLKVTAPAIGEGVRIVDIVFLMPESVG